MEEGKVNYCCDGVVRYCGLTFVLLVLYEVDVTPVLDASFYINVGNYRGNAVAVTSTKALTALHGKSGAGDDVELIDGTGQKRRATVIFSKFVELQVDIAVVELCDGEDVFPVCIPISTHSARLLQPIIVVGITSGLDDTATVYAAQGQVTLIEPTGALFRSTYACHDGLSRAGVIVAIEDGTFHVVGVHVASHDNTEAPPPIKKMKSSAASADSVSENTQSLASSIHGHTAYCLICDITRVPDAIEVIQASL